MDKVKALVVFYNVNDENFANAYKRFLHLMPKTQKGTNRVFQAILLWYYNEICMHKRNFLSDVHKWYPERLKGETRGVFTFNSFSCSKEFAISFPKIENIATQASLQKFLKVAFLEFMETDNMEKLCQECERHKKAMQKFFYFITKGESHGK